MLRYFKNILIGIDQLINTLFLGDPDETISSRTGSIFVLTVVAGLQQDLMLSSISSKMTIV